MTGCLTTIRKTVGWGFVAIVALAIVGNMINPNHNRSARSEAVVWRSGTEIVLDERMAATATALLLESTGTTLPADTPIPPSPTSTLVPTVTPTLAWYTGGTLHSATVAEWRAADQRNKLATAADWSANGFDLNTLNDIDFYAHELLDCIDTAFDTYAQTYGESGSMTDFAVTCVILIKGS